LASGTPGAGADECISSLSAEPAMAATTRQVAAAAAAGRPPRLGSRERQRSEHHEVALASRLRGLAESSSRVRGILTRHGWVAGSSKWSPDYEHLLRDLVRTGRISTLGGVGGKHISICTGSSSSGSSSSGSGIGVGASRPAAAAAAAAAVAAEAAMDVSSSEGRHGSAAAFAPRPRTATSGGAIAACHRAHYRRQRAASWCGQRSTASTCYAQAASRTRFDVGRLGARSP